MIRVNHLCVRVCFAGLMAALMLNAQNPPAPTVDRVGFPANYQTTMNPLYIFDRPDTKRILITYGNDAAFQVQRGAQNNYPYGSILVNENWPALLDAQGNPVLDANGRFQKDPAGTLAAINVMRKEKGFGVDYGPNQGGEWEYVSYTPSGAYATMPQNSFVCAICHLQAGQGKDWVFRASLHFNNASGSAPGGVIKNYTFVPGTLHVKAGSFVTFYNDDVVRHTIVDDSAGGFASPLINAGSSVLLKFGDTPFEWDFHCSIHPNMHGKIIVDPK